MVPAMIDDRCILTETDQLICEECFDDGARDNPRDDDPNYWVHKRLEWDGERACSFCGYKGEEYEFEADHG